MMDYTKPKFHTAYEPLNDDFAEVNTLPSCTIPDQSMTIQEIIAKYTRSGMVPQSFLRQDSGGNVAGDLDADPLDQSLDAAFELLSEAQAAHGSETEPDTPAPDSEPESIARE